MPIPNLTDETPINQYTANSGETEFAFTFYIFALSDIKVYANDVLKTITTDYVVRKNDGTVIGDADLPMDGGKIIFNVGRTAGEKISLNRDIPVDRSTQFSTGGAFKADSLNSELTRILTIAQQLKRDVARSFRLAPSDAEGGSLQLPTNRANNILAFDANANLILTKLADIDKANVSPFIATLLDDVSASIARGTLDAQQLNANLTALAGLAGVANLTALAGLNGSANKIPYFTGSGAMALRDLLATTTTQGVVYRKSPTVQKFTSGSGTYTTPAEVLYLKVRMTGGGGGGGGSGTGGGTGGTGGNSTFGTSLLTSNGGAGGAFNAQGASGGTATVSSPAISILDIAGNNGGTAEQARAFAYGGSGGSNPISGISPMSNATAGLSGKLGGGGAGGSAGGTAIITGSGGGAGAYIEAIISSPSATYSYAVGSGGAGGTAGTSGFAGGAGGNGFIEITEYYN